MAETEYTVTARLDPGVIWDFVQDMDNWAAFLTGYQSHEKHSETESVWTLKGDLGVLARTVRFGVHVTEWSGPERVTFALKGLNEDLSGEGSFRMEAYRGEDEPPADTGKGWLARLFEGLFRRLLRRFGGGAERRVSPGAEATARLSFRLRIDAGGPMAPMLDAMLKPAMAAAAEDLANKIVVHLEDGRST